MCARQPKWKSSVCGGGGGTRHNTTKKGGRGISRPPTRDDMGDDNATETEEGMTTRAVVVVFFGVVVLLAAAVVGWWCKRPTYIRDRCGHVSITYRKCKRLFSRYNRHTRQLVEIYESALLGRVLVIDGDIQLCEFDEHRYHEMLVHVPMAYVPERSQARVLVIGGGDGGAVRELCKYDQTTVSEIVVVDIDAVVVGACHTLLPSVSRTMHQDPRVTLYIEDAARFLAGLPTTDPRVPKFDVIIIDLTDFGASDSVFRDTETRYNITRVLTPNGIVVRNYASVGYTYSQRDHLRELRSDDVLGSHFNYTYLYQCFQPTFMGGQYTFAFMSDACDPPQEPWPVATGPVRDGRTKYYTLDVHRGSFALPAHMISPHPVR